MTLKNRVDVEIYVSIAVKVDFLNGIIRDFITVNSLCVICALIVKKLKRWDYSYYSSSAEYKK